MLTIKKYALTRNQVTQVVQIPKYFQPIGVVELNPMSAPTLHVLCDDSFAVEDVTVYTFEEGDDLTAYPFIRTDMLVGTYRSSNMMDAQMVFL